MIFSVDGVNTDLCDFEFQFQFFYFDKVTMSCYSILVPDSYEPVKPDYKHNARDGGEEKNGVVKFAKLVDHAIIPCRGTAKAAGMFYACSMW